MLPANVPILEHSTPLRLRELFFDLPPLTANVSKPKGTAIETVLTEIERSSWLKGLAKARNKRTADDLLKVQQRIRIAANNLRKAKRSSGAEIVSWKSRPKTSQSELGQWLQDQRIGGVCHHSTKSHMSSDLHRYIFCSAFADVIGVSPKLADFPEALLPDHKNVQGKTRDLKKHADRFRALPYLGFSPTITSHLSRDGHAFIHPDPDQLRSITVREAARIQTFPDNYFFEGGKSAQYYQVGNAVPPFLAHQIATIVAQVLGI